MISRKGILVASQVCEKMGQKLVVAGQGCLDYSNGVIHTEEGDIKGEYVGTVGVKERGELMKKAKAVFVPTQYIGPFEGVSIEANLCGTPVITTDWGCFAENVIDGVTGYRCRTFGENLWAAKQVEKLNYKKIREYAVNKFSINVVKYKYQEYFQRLVGLIEDGHDWYRTDYDPKNRILGNFR